MGEGGLAVVRLRGEEALLFQDAGPRERRLGLLRGLAHLAIGPAGRAREPEAVAAHHPQPGLYVVVIQAAPQRTRGHHDRLTIAEEAQQRVRFREGEGRRFLGGPETTRAPDRGQGVRVASLGQGRPSPRALRFSAPAEHGRAFRCRLAHRIPPVPCGRPRSVRAACEKRIAACHSSAECHSERVVYFGACASSRPANPTDPPSQ